MYRSVPHTADLAYEITFSNLEELFEDIVGIIRENAVFEEDPEISKEEIFEVGEDVADAVFDLTNEMIFLVETGWIPKGVEFDGKALKVVFNRLKRLERFDLKALTYHMLGVEEIGSKKRLKVVFDV